MASVGGMLMLTALSLVATSSKAAVKESVIHVPYTLPKNSVITSFASFTHEPFEEEFNYLFHIYANGNLSVKNNLHQHVGKSFPVLLRSATIDQQPFHKKITIAIEDRSFLFVFPQQKYTAIVKENLPSWTDLKIAENLNVLGAIGQVEYKIVSNDRDVFEVLYNDGNLHIHTTKPLDREKREQYSFQLEAKLESREITTCEICVKVLDENDCKPIFLQNVYEKSVITNVTPGQQILKVKASDNDLNDHISYFVQGNLEFQIDRLTGDIFVINTLTPNHIYKFHVYAKDLSGRIASSKVHVTTGPSVLKFMPYNHHIRKRQASITDTVERTFEIFENTTAGTVLFDISSDVLPVGVKEYFSIVSSTFDAFQVDTRGNVYLKGLNTSKLDYEEPSHRNITIVFNITTSSLGTSSPQGEYNTKYGTSKNYHHSVQHHHIIIGHIESTGWV